MSIQRNFVFVVFDDPLVVGVLDFLHSAMMGAPLRLRPHITIQGPFGGKVGAEKIRKIASVLKEDVFLIGNPGVFWGEVSTLFFRVQSENLARVWLKPDFPTNKYGFNPHVTVYEGSDTELVKRAYDFLKKNRVELICREFSVVQYVPKQMDMFPNEGADGDDDALSKFIAKGSIPSSFRAKFLAAVN